MKVFQQPNYSENFVQSVFDVVEGKAGATLVIGGDGRYPQSRCHPAGDPHGGGERLCEGAGRAGRYPVDAGCMSNIIRQYGAIGGLVLSASHNPGRPDEDFGIQYNARTVVRHPRRSPTPSMRAR